MKQQSNTEWRVRVTERSMRQSPVVRAISDALDLTPVTAQLLINRGCTTPENAADFLSKKTELFHDPFSLKDIREAAETVLSAVEEKKKIVIFGDYDVDGVTSVSCLYLYLKSLGASPEYYIPSRSGDGYGMTDAALTRLAQEGAEVVVTVDTGITAVHEAETAASLGLTLVITDHHECTASIPHAAAAVNPHRQDDVSPFKELAGVGVVFKLLCAMESLRSPELPMGECVRRICMEYADLIAIGTIADVMPIVGENRLIVAFGLHLIETSPREGVRALLDAATSESKTPARRRITSSLVGFTIAPRINAAGRLQDASLAVELFLSQDAEKAREVAHRLCDINRERQNEENAILSEAYAQIDARHDFTKDPVIILDSDRWHHGVIGIVASRITERYGLPCILISFENQNGTAAPEPSPEDLGRGSGRSVKGMNLVDALSASASCLVKFGGHELAAGLTVQRSKLPELRKSINDYARACFASGLPTPVLEAECELNAADMTILQAEELYRLEPFGTGNPTPLFYTASMTVADVSAVGGGKHIRFYLTRDGITVTAMFFRRSPEDIDVYPGDRIDIMYQLDVNEFQGNRTVQCILREIRLSEDISAEEEAEHLQYRNVCEAMENGSVLSVETFDAVCPRREDFAAVYTALKHETSLGHTVYSIRALRHLLRSGSTALSYVRLKLILSAMSELRLFAVETAEDPREIYRFRYIPQTTKIDLQSASVMQRIRRCDPAEHGGE